MNIAILHCLRSTRVCTGASCFKAYNNGTHAFAAYDEKPALCAFFHCGGCDMDWEKDPGMIEKMQRLQSENVQRIHVGICIGDKCVHRDKIFAMLEQYGMECVFGTH